LALDEPKDHDHRVEQDGLRFAMGPELRIWFAFGRSIHIDYDRWTDGFPVYLSGARCC
jgi:hypothetical protein